MAIECPVSGGRTLGCGDQTLKVTLPGGPTLQVMVPNLCPSSLDITKNLLAQANAALAPLVPIFRLIEIALALKDLAESIPSLLTDPTALIQAIAEIIKKIAEVAGLVPFLSVPLFIVELLDVIIASLDAAIEELAKIIEQELKIAAAGLKAAEFGNEALLEIVECAEGLNLQIKLGLSEGMAPLNALFGVINIFLGLIGQPEIPSFDDLPEDASEAVEQLTVVVDILQNVRNAIPIP